MRRLAHGSPALVALLALAVPGVARAAWSHNPLTPARIFPTESSNQTVSAAVEDGRGGAFVFIVDDRNGGQDIYAQHLLANGDRDPAWPENGLALCTANGPQSSIAAAADGAGGAFVCWSDSRDGSPRNFVTRIHASGSVAAGFPADGKLVDAVHLGSQGRAHALADGLGGVVLVWEYQAGPANLDLHGARVAGDGTITWVQPLASNPQDDWLPKLCLESPGVFAMMWVNVPDLVLFGTWRASFFQQMTGISIENTADPDAQPQLASDGLGGLLLVWLRDLSGTPVVRAARWSEESLLDAGMMPLNTGDDIALLDLSPPHGFRNVLLWSSRTNRALHASWLLLDEGFLGNVLMTNGNLDTTQVARVLPIPDAEVRAFSGRLAFTGPVNVAFNSLEATPYGAYGTTDGYLAMRLSSAVQLGAVCSDGNQGALVFGHHAAPGNRRAYAMRVDWFGAYDGAPRILGVRDVAGDQGGRVRLDWEASYLEGWPWGPLEAYRIWRQVPVSAAQAHLTVATEPLVPGSIRFDERDGVVFAWEYVTSQVPANFPAYSITLESVSDSSAAGPANTVFMVEAVEGTGALHWPSAPDSGHSVDNLPPAMPAPFSAALVGGASTQLTWGPNSEPDLAGYELHRGTDAAFVPGPASLVATTSSTSFLDGAAGYHYKLAAVDVHGNRSGYALVTPGGTLDAPSELLPRVVSLGLTSRNPSSGGAVFRLELPEAQSVRLAVFDLHGRLVRELIAGPCEAGTRTVRWDGRAASGAVAPSGIYLASLDAGGQRFVRRVVLSR